MSQAEYVKTALRLPPDLHEKLHEAADKRGRSLNAEILERLIASFDPKPQQRWEREFLADFRAEIDRLSKIPSPKR